ncbi:MAG: alpha-1,4-glucan--maltose-1-phosphate maltosyltransferase [Bdellovibrionales bacterium]
MRRPEEIKNQAGSKTSPPDLKQRPSRVIIDRLMPEIDAGRFAAKRFIDEPIEVSTILLVDGHDQVKGHLLYRHTSEPDPKALPLVPRGNDVWVARFQPEKLGRYYVSVEAALDRFGTWKSDVKKKLIAGQIVALELEVGAQLLESWVEEVGEIERRLLVQAVQCLRDWARSESSPGPNEFGALVEDPALEHLAESVFDETSLVRYKREVPIQVEPVIARFSSWYEFFPRSTVDGTLRHGTFRDAEERLEYIRKMGFDVVYLPPIHPIGKTFRKGKNNALAAEPGDVGSPWAIGGEDGGHRALHPDLGNLEDFARFVKRAGDLGLHVALDIAFQCSPDHPYVKEHPEWFKKRPDGSIQYAENPPKKYQDIYPFDFECENWRALWTELRDVIQYWVDQGVKVFRVDNPHTKAFDFWEWCIADIRSRHPEVIFLAEAFTRPHIMAYLAKSGFGQSYTYFAWRNVKWELTQYLTELTQTELVEYFSPNFWPNTPDILTAPLQSPNRALYMQRAVLAATLSSNWGIYGPPFELMEHRPRHKGSEEYLDSEKYQLRSWDLNRPDSLAPFIERLNEIRRGHKSFQQNRTLRFLPVPNEQILAFAKTYGEEKMVVVVNLDAHHVQSGMVELPLIDWGISPDEPFEVHDLLSNARYFWTGWRNYVELNPATTPAHIFRVRARLSSDRKGL